MKKLLITALFVSSTFAANAGSVAYIAPEAVTLEEPAMMGGSGSWLIPLIIIGVMALALGQNNNCKKPPIKGESAICKY